MTLYPLDIEYRKALKTYLSKYADHYIKNIGQNAWISLFSDKLLAEVCEILIIVKKRYFLYLFNFFLDKN